MNTTLKRAGFVAPFALVVGLLGCPSEVGPPGSGGAGGVGNGDGGAGGGSGGAGGGAGGAASNCPDDVLATIMQPPPNIGFDSPPGAPANAALSKVTSSSLEMTLGAGGQPFVFTFVGPDLTAYFTVGELVSVSVSGDWHVVANAKATAATARPFAFVEGPLSATPGGGPSIDFEPQCSVTEIGFCSKMPSEVSPLQVVAALGPDTALVKFGATGAVGAFQVTNAFAIQYPGDAGPDGCHVEAAFQASISVLGPGVP